MDADIKLKREIIQTPDRNELHYSDALVFIKKNKKKPPEHQAHVSFSAAGTQSDKNLAAIDAWPDFCPAPSSTSSSSTSYGLE